MYIYVYIRTNILYRHSAVAEKYNRAQWNFHWPAPVGQDGDRTGRGRGRGRDRARPRACQPGVQIVDYRFPNGLYFDVFTFLCSKCLVSYRGAKRRAKVHKGNAIENSIFNNYKKIPEINNLGNAVTKYQTNINWKYNPLGKSTIDKPSPPWPLPSHP